MALGGIAGYKTPDRRAFFDHEQHANPSGLPLPDDAPDTHPKVAELRELMQWSEGQMWCSPERHGSMSAVFKAQIDWVPWRWARYVQPKVKLSH